MDRVPKIPKAGWLAGGAVVVVVVAVIAVVSLGSSSSSSASSLLSGSGYPNGDTSNTRYTQGPINSGTVSKLETAWTLPLTAKSQYGSYSSSPIVSGGGMFSQDLASNVQAIDVKTGKVIWTKNYESPDQGPNGLVVAGGRVYGATATAAFALDEKTGAQVWSVTLVRNEHEGIDMAPGYHDGIVYVSTVPGNNAKFYGGEGVGILWALEASTGKKLWHFDTAPENLWSPENASVNSGGGLWYSPAFDEQGNMYVGTGNPAPFPGTDQLPWGSSRPGPNLYTDSIVKLNASTGKVVWYYQLTPHDLYDHDLQDPPILANVGGRQVVIAAGKAGFVLALDAQTGKLLWKRSVGVHNGHDNDGTYAMKQEYSKLSMPETVYPGLLGGVIAPMSTNGSTVFVPVVNHPVTIATQSETQENGPITGELVALDAATGTVRWSHKFPSAAFGATTAVNDLVFATTFEGTVFAFDASTGSVAWETKLPAGTNTGVAVSGNTLIAPAGIATAAGQTPEIVAYRLPGGTGGSGTG
ncbi:MAG TPA: PQQ-binding-like beta-propeller repeat protein [Solirubrobacteraceae bacterium]|nr:PQQ-binding-like beta-propeller repeat protein [Solirubrobacteraceae bacterium]